MDSIGCIVALIEFVVAIVAAAICCRGSCGYGTVATQQTVVSEEIIERFCKSMDSHTDTDTLTLFVFT